MGSKGIIVQTPPNTEGKPEVNLVKSDFDAAIEQKGYDVYHDHAIKCPCSSRDGVAAQSNCKNCGGGGWFYVNRTQTRMIVQSMNVTTQYREWSEERIGTSSITARAEDRLSFMDRIILLDSESDYSQVIFLKKQPTSNKLYGVLRYQPIYTYSVFMYKSIHEKHILLVEGEDYIIEDRMIKTLDLEEGDVSEPTISIRYRHNVEYTIVDLQRDVMVQREKEKCTGATVPAQFPIYAVGRKSHYLLDSDNFQGTKLLDNSFKREK